MNRLQWVLALMLSMTAAALASNPQDEQVVRNAYAKLAYAVQARTVYDAVRKTPKITSLELTKELQAKELRYDITDMSSGAISDIESKPYSDFVTRPDTQPVLRIVEDKETFDENGSRATSNFAQPRWAAASQSQEDWDIPIKGALAQSGNGGKFVRYVSATITVRFQGRSRTYHTLWLFGSGILALDLIGAADNVVTEFATRDLFPSVLTDTSLRSRPAVGDWLNSTQRFESSCKTGKQDVCCDSAMHCGVAAEDLRSTKPAPNTTSIPKGGL